MPAPPRRRILLYGGGGNLADRSAGFDASATLSAANNGIFTPANNEAWTVVFWVYFNALGAGDYISMVNTQGTDAATDSWYVQRDGTNSKIAFGYSNGTFYSQVDLAAPVTSQWYMVHAHWTNGGSPFLTGDLYDTSAVRIINTTTGGSGYINTTQNNRLYVGSSINPGAVKLNGRIDKLGLWNRGLLESEVITLHGGGFGLTYTEMVAAGLASGIQGWGDFDEKTGSLLWPDSLGVNNFTATGSVTSQPPAGVT